MFDKGRALIKKNEGPEVTYLSNEAKKYMNILFDISENLITSNFSKVREIIYNNNILDFEKFSDMDTYEFEIIAIYSCMRPLPSYGLYISTAYDSLMHENYILYHLVIKSILIEINSLHRIFFDDVFEINSALILMSKKLGRSTSNASFDCSFELYYKDCIYSCYPIGDCLRTKYDLVYLKKSIYEKETFDDKKLSEDLEKYSENGMLKSFVYELDNYINKIGNSFKSPEILKYLRDALVMNFLLGNYPWNKHFSKSLLKAIIGYSKCFDSEKVTSYTKEMKNFVFEVLATIQVITISKAGTFLQEINKERFYLQLVIFLINLYYVFPFEEVIDYAEEISINNLSDGICQDAYREIEKQILLIKSNQKDSNKTFNMFTTSSTTKITNVEIIEQSDYPKFTRIQLEIDMVDIYNIDVELKFYDKDRQQICSDKPYILTFDEKDSEKGHYAYVTTILEGNLIQYVEANIVRKGKKLSVNVKNTSDVDNTRLNQKSADEIMYKNNVNNDFTNTQKETYNDNDSASIWWGILGYLLPPVGFVLWFTWQETMPKKANKLCIGALISIILNTILLLGNA